MRKYQEEIQDSIRGKKNYGGGNVVIDTNNGVQKVFYYGNTIGIINHKERTYSVNNCGFKNASTSARINAIKEACEDLEYTMVTKG